MSWLPTVVADLCRGVSCKYGASCELGVCVCPTDCPSGPEEPVCASNMHTYTNECEMQKQACLTEPPLSLTVVFYGDCNDRLTPVSTSKHFLIVLIRSKHFYTLLFVLLRFKNKSVFDRFCLVILNKYLYIHTLNLKLRVFPDKYL